MCGIFGMLLRRPLRDADIRLGRFGRDALTHRGPDAEGEHIDCEAGLYFGHRRLKIVDLSDGGAQPMTDGACVLTYNGEIYNYRELRDQLSELGVRFRSDSDTEVLLAAWRRWGRGTLDRLDGMFAFALWDGETLYLANDPFGEKPLYIVEQSDGVWFSSELAPLVQALGLQPDMSGDPFMSFMALGFIANESTAYPGASRLMPASLVEVRDCQVATVGRYWSPPPYEPRDSALEPLSDAAVDDVADILIESLRRRLIADVPLCLLLSNGVDSSLIAALAAKELDADLTCLTVNFDGDDRNESDAAASVARGLGLKHISVPGRFDPDQVTPDLLLDRFGQPNENAAISSVEQVAKAAREAGFVVGLTGFGGDEAFLGYLKHQLLWRQRKLYGMPAALRLAAGALMAPLAGAHQRFRAFRHLLAVPDSELYLALKNQPAISSLQQLPGFSGWARRTFEHWRQIEFDVPEYDRSSVLPSSQLVSSDLGSMHYSFELRTPFLSRRLFERLGEFDPRSFLAFGQKAMTRSLLSRYLPRNAILRGKRGFLFPMQRLIDNRRGSPPAIPGVPEALVRDVFNRDDQGHMRLALRFLILERFPHWHAALLEQSVSFSAEAACAS